MIAGQSTRDYNNTLCWAYTKSRSICILAAHNLKRAPYNDGSPGAYKTAKAYGQTCAALTANGAHS